jgi:hypothetical protein
MAAAVISKATDEAQPSGEPVVAAKKMARWECGSWLWRNREWPLMTRYLASAASDPSCTIGLWP